MGRIKKIDQITNRVNELNLIRALVLFFINFHYFNIAFN